jgi:WD40 repeat protein
MHRQDRSSLALAAYKNPQEMPKLQQAYDNLSTHARQVFAKMCESGVKQNSAPDEDDLEIDWIHGLRAFDTRNNVRYASTQGNARVIVYHAASMGVCLQTDNNPRKCKQRYFKGHKDDIMALAVYTPAKTAGAGQSQSVVATGQQGLAPVYVWDAGNQQLLATIATEQKSVHMLEFSADGRLLVSIAEDKSVAVSDWKSQVSFSLIKLTKPNSFSDLLGIGCSQRLLVNTKGEAAVTFHIASSSTSQNPGSAAVAICLP